jgi:hypothetical protein
MEEYVKKYEIKKRNQDKIDNKKEPEIYSLNKGNYLVTKILFQKNILRSFITISGVSLWQGNLLQSDSERKGKKISKMHQEAIEA